MLLPPPPASRSLRPNHWPAGERRAVKGAGGARGGKEGIGVLPGCLPRAATCRIPSRARAVGRGLGGRGAAGRAALLRPPATSPDATASRQRLPPTSRGGGGACCVRSGRVRCFAVSKSYGPVGIRSAGRCAGKPDNRKRGPLFLAHDSILILVNETAPLSFLESLWCAYGIPNHHDYHFASSINFLSRVVYVNFASCFRCDFHVPHLFQLDFIRE